MADRHSLCTLALALLLPAAAAAAEQEVAEQRLALAPDQSVSLSLRSGTLVVEARGEPGEVLARLELSCGEAPGCARRAERLGLGVELKPKRLAIEANGLPRLSPQDHVTMTVQLPDSVPLEIGVGAGEVRVRGHRGWLEIDVGSGRVEIETERVATRSVQLDSGLGDVEISLGGEVLSGAGLLLGSELRWAQPSGSAEIEVDCGVGDVRVDLR